MGAGSQENHVIRALELSSPRPDLKRERLGTESFTNGQRFNQSCLCNTASGNIQKDRTGELAGQ